MNEEKVKRLEELYSLLPKMECKGLCQADCAGIMMSGIEAARINETVGQVVAKPWPLAPGTFYMKVATTPKCPLLGLLGECTVYKVRPLICRAYGAVKRMTCAHGCRPERYISDIEFLEIYREIENLSK